MKPTFTIDKFPFKVLFNLRALIKYWEDLAGSSDPMQAKCAQTVMEKVNALPELHELGLKFSIVDKHRDLISFLFTGLISPYQIEHGIAGATVPYNMDLIFATRKFKALFGTSRASLTKSIFGSESENFYGPTIHVYSMILKQFYNVDISFDIPVFNIKIADKETGLIKYYSMKTDHRFVQIRPAGNKKKLTGEEIRLIRENYFDLSMWMKILPPENFVLEGFGLFNAVEDTLQQSVASIQNKLLEKESIINRASFDKIVKRMRSLLSIPDVEIGVAVFNEDPKSLALFRNTWLTILSDPKIICSHYQNSIYEKAAVKMEPMIVGDLREYERTFIEDQLLEAGYRSLMVIPLKYDNETVGLIEMASPHTGEFSTGVLVKLHPVLSAFGIAAKRQAIDLENRIKAKIQEEFTAIHPAVEWKFEEVATEQLNREMTGEAGKKKPIIFKEIYPLFGVSDVKSSSHLRNDAIRDDLLEQISMLENVISMVKKARPLPILDHLKYNLGLYREDIENEISTGDEVKILNFIREEVEPVLKHLSTLQEELEGITGVYFDMLDEDLGIFYRRRKDFEESMRMINDEVSTLIDKHEEEAQAMFPHYFEKYRTDGIEYSIYIGESLVQNRAFDPIYLKNIRLWQLMLMCRVTQATGRLIKDLPLQLETTQLILVHNQPIAIRFRDDEKKFDVEGAYNLRYEITKKRIDKATVKGGSERIVQPGHIAIIYSQETEKSEYMKFLEYLVATGYLEDSIEHFNIENMQGIYGLSALRVKVKDPVEDDRLHSLAEIEEVVGKMNE